MRLQKPVDAGTRRELTVVIICKKYLAVLVVFMAASAASSDLGEAQGYTGVKLGFIGSGDVKVDDLELTQSEGFSFGLFFDQPVGEYFHYGLAADLHRMNWSGDGDASFFAQSETLLDFSLNFKGNLWVADGRLLVRPGVGIGFGTQRRRSRLNGTNYLTIKAFAELVMFPGFTKGVVLDAGIWHAPNGGDQDHDMKIGPFVYARAGVLF